MLMNIITTTFAVVLFFGKPTAIVIKKIDKMVSAKKEDKAARKKAMEDYLSREIVDIEH